MGTLLEGSILFTKEKKMKTKSIFDSKQNKSFVAEICPICGGHEYKDPGSAVAGRLSRFLR